MDDEWITKPPFSLRDARQKAYDDLWEMFWRRGEGSPLFDDAAQYLAPQDTRPLPDNVLPFRPKRKP